MKALDRKWEPTSFWEPRHGWSEPVPRIKPGCEPVRVDRDQDGACWLGPTQPHWRQGMKRGIPGWE